MRKLKTKIGQILFNSQGWRTKRKIVVIESDDWGSIRIPNKEVLNELRSSGIQVEKCSYVQNDSLEDNEDMEALYNIIEKKDNKPVITANFLTANPDFKKIKESGFTSYFNESIDETILNRPNSDKVKDLYTQGQKAGFFIPQLHGREHLNISRWMTDLQNNNEETRLAFELGVFGISNNAVKQKRWSYQAAFDKVENDFGISRVNILKDAVEDFERMFGFKSITFIAPNYVWDSKIEEITSQLHIKYLQGGNMQRQPLDTSGRYAVKKNVLGQKNKFGQRYLFRNSSFEPSADLNKDWVNSCLSEIKSAFFWNKPAVISMHRVNFIGSINPENRERNLKLFSELVDAIQKNWPEVEFMSSDQLAKLIK
ncbi:hypothetical protein GCM10007424_10050 [Flavobacterium suaedae]|uniref:Polysaccharide (De)acetylase n=1 Tax=Flavobacterium suaedae TaxID=1767027 RepID=A0ABQ1JMJ0_9FLAO|nr:hypothetical protein [Flavobacterium suaedae]GGB72050.1 hypothetical protein GCM10007424_10050 [Flavobacterium suaedae]